MKDLVLDRAISLFGKELTLMEIHRTLFEGVFLEAGKIRKEVVTEEGFIFESPMFLPDTLKIVERMPENSFDDIINKYIEMIIAHPFKEGNDFALRLWLDISLSKNIKARVDWAIISKEDYLSSLKRSAINPDILSMLIKSALTSDIDNKELLVKSIEQSLSF